MKVYVITKGEYSEYGIYAVTLDKEQAELLKAEYSDKWDEAFIEEYDTDNSWIEVSDDYKPIWNVEFRCRDNKIVRCYKISHDNIRHGEIFEVHWYNNKRCDELKVFVEAKDEEHAEKIATDRYMKWLAEQNNL